MSGQLEGLELDSTVQGGSVAMPEDLIPEGATDVYKNYKFQHKYSKLPILEARDEVRKEVDIKKKWNHLYIHLLCIVLSAEKIICATVKNSNCMQFSVFRHFLIFKDNSKYQEMTKGDWIELFLFSSTLSLM